jgi:SAM-dependent methyltransferase
VFRQRARSAESLDRPDSDPGLTERSFGFIRFVNRAGGGIRVVRRFLDEELRKRPAREEVRVLDIGCGDCDIPIALARWADEHGHRLQFTCIDHNATVFALARSRLAESGDDDIKLELADVFSYEPTSPFDYAIGSMFFHHFTDDEIGRLITHLRRFVRRALLINDLHRCFRNYLVCSLFTVGVEPELRHDALLSIRRGFTPGELAQLLRRHDPAAAVHTAWFCRIAGVARFDGKEGEGS